jgi:hypothetical protein
MAYEASVDGVGGTRPERMAQVATSVREVMLSLVRMLETWTEAVLVEM